MALSSFILAPGSNELEKWSCVRKEEASRPRKGDSEVLPSLCPGEGKERGHEAPSPQDTCLNVPKKVRGGRIFVTV